MGMKQRSNFDSVLSPRQDRVYRIDGQEGVPYTSGTRVSCDASYDAGTPKGKEEGESVVLRSVGIDIRRVRRTHARAYY